MSIEDKILYAFVTGEVSPAFWGRTDLSKYDLGVALAENFYVDYKGGLVSRQGSEYSGPLVDGSWGKLARFQGTVADYLLVFTDFKLRFMQNNAYVTEAAKAISGITQANPGVVTSTAHGFSNGDLVRIEAATGMTELHQRQLLVANATANTFELTDQVGVAIDTTDFAAADATETVARVYTIVTPYAGSKLQKLDVQQRYNEVRLTHKDYLRRKLVFTSATNWTLSVVTSGSSVTPPGTLTGTPSGAGTAGTSFVVTSVDSNGTESEISPYLLETAMVNYTTTAGSYTLNWAPVDGAISYNVYRGYVLYAGTDVTRGMDMAYIGSVTGTQFTDSNITPDYSKTPPVSYDPFAVMGIDYIDILTTGTGYAKGTTMTISGPGTGFVGYPIVDNAGQITGIKVISSGAGYSSPAVVLANTGGGTGATFTIYTRGETGQTNPGLFRVFQQRGVYFSSLAEPATLWASKPKLLNNFDYSQIVNAGDGYSFTFDSVAVKPIKHALVIRNGMLVFTDDGITQLRAETGKAVTAINALAEPQVYTGISDTPPIALDLDVLFLEHNSTSLNSLLYTEYTESFQLQDLSVLASHLFTDEAPILRLTYSANPYKQVYMPREDGTMLTLTHLREQEVFGWARHTTYGKFKDCVEIEEADGNFVYLIVERYLQGKWQQYVERLPKRKDDFAENFWGVDCGLALPLTQPAATLWANGTTGSVTLTAGAAVFTAGNVGDIVYYAGGKLEVTAYLNTQQLTATWLREPTITVSHGAAPLLKRAAEGEWSIDTPVSEVSGLWHLEGETVSVQYDGNAELDVVVADGKVTLQSPSTKVHIGLPYKCRGVSLPMIIPNRVVEGQESKIFAVIPRLLNTRGLAFGDSFDSLEEMEDRTDEDWGEALGLRTDVDSIAIDSYYGQEAQIYWEQVYPLPVTLLGFVARMDVGEK